MTSFRTVLYLLLRFLCNVINLTFNFKSVVRKGVRRNLFFVGMRVVFTLGVYRCDASYIFEWLVFFFFTYTTIYFLFQRKYSLWFIFIFDKLSQKIL